MARIRTIKPEFFRHEGLQDLEAENPGLYCMLVFAGLWGHCDSQGVFEFRPRQLKLDILPFLDFDMSATLDCLVDAGFIQTFDHDGKRYGVIKSFADHQRLSGKESGEAGVKHPAPTEEIDILTRKHRGSNGEAPGKQRGSGRERPESQEKERNKERNKEMENTSCRDKITTEDVPLEIVVSSSLGPTPEDHWHEFVSAYPKRLGDLGKAKGREKFLRLLKAGVEPERIVSGANRYRQLLIATGKNGTEYVKQIPTFLNSRAWEEEFEVDVGRNGKPQAVDHLARIQRERELREARLACPN